MNIYGSIMMMLLNVVLLYKNEFLKIYEDQSFFSVSTFAPLVGPVIIGPTMFTTMVGDKKCVEMRCPGLDRLSTSLLTYLPPEIAGLMISAY